MSIEVFLLLLRDFKIVFHIRKIHSFFLFFPGNLNSKFTYSFSWCNWLYNWNTNYIGSKISYYYNTFYRKWLSLFVAINSQELKLGNYCSTIKMIFQYQLFSIFSLQKKRQFLKINLTWSNIKEIYGRMNGFVRYGLLIYNLISFQPSFHNNF